MVEFEALGAVRGSLCSARSRSAIKAFQPVIDAIIELAETLRQGTVGARRSLCPRKAATRAKLRAEIGPGARSRRQGSRGKQERKQPARRGQSPGGRDVRRSARGATAIALKLFKDLEKDIVRGAIIRGEKRIDGRDTKTVRPIYRRGRGAAAHPRLGAVHPRRDPGDRRLDAGHRPGRADHRRVEGEYRQHFMLHYNFPPYSTGEAGRMGSPGRREIGHGKLAWRAVRPMLPSKESFPYTIRVVSEITDRTARRRWPRCAAPRCR